ncbi:MAG TPA: TM2 domain-containing protein [Gallicola sp.]|nr:TM2 domain-containing protein [Gallicola sp.]
MDIQKVDMYLMINKKYFPNEKILILKEKLEQLDDDRYHMLMGVELKDPTTLLLVSIFLGSMGIDRFMLGDIGMGILKLLTVGLCGILTIIDWFIVSTKTKELNFEKVMQIF